MMLPQIIHCASNLLLQHTSEMVLNVCEWVSVFLLWKILLHVEDQLQNVFRNHFYALHVN